MSVDQLRHEVAVLEGRLQDGEHKIAAAEAKGTYVKRWVDYWLELLRRYERAYNRLQAAERHRSGRRAA